SDSGATMTLAPQTGSTSAGEVFPASTRAKAAVGASATTGSNATEETRATAETMDASAAHATPYTGALASEHALSPSVAAVAPAAPAGSGASSPTTADSRTHSGAGTPASVPQASQPNAELTYASPGPASPDSPSAPLFPNTETPVSETTPAPGPMDASGKSSLDPESQISAVTPPSAAQPAARSTSAPAAAPTDSPQVVEQASRAPLPSAGSPAGTGTADSGARQQTVGSPAASPANSPSSLPSSFGHGEGAAGIPQIRGAEPSSSSTHSREATDARPARAVRPAPGADAPDRVKAGQLTPEQATAEPNILTVPEQPPVISAGAEASVGAEAGAGVETNLAASADAGTFPLSVAGVPMQEMIDSIGATIELAARQGIARARIELQPEELGHISIRLSQTSEGLRARVTAETPAGAQALTQGRGELRQTLSSMGVSLLRLDIDSSGQSQTGEQNGRWSGKADGTNITGATNAPEEGEALGEPRDIHPAGTPLGEIVDVLA
ncbi:MAG TPA: flagellar hook-length control protein FliK, partial [Solirubrobacteraceae bacterium]|nr:flagellar hook-length control protein FliK [Solirubrobacteraceae bacterium]